MFVMLAGIVGDCYVVTGSTSCEVFIAEDIKIQERETKYIEQVGKREREGMNK